MFLVVSMIVGTTSVNAFAMGVSNSISQNKALNEGSISEDKAGTIEDDSAEGLSDNSENEETEAVSEDNASVSEDVPPEILAISEADLDGDGELMEEIAEGSRENAKFISFGNRDYNINGAIDKDGNLWMWGENGGGQIGDGSTNDRLTPFNVLKNVKDFKFVPGYSGKPFCGAIDKDGNLWMWGGNSHGQIGNGTTTDLLTPYKVSENIVDFSLGLYGSGAIDKDGNLWMWGANDHGQIGNGATTDCLTPYRVLENVKEFKMETTYSGAIDKDGNLWMWGYNGYGQIGNGTTTDCLTPYRVLENVKEYKLEYTYSGAIDKDGNLWMWGNNLSGQLGIGAGINSHVPVQVLPSVDKFDLSGYSTVVALDKDGNLWMWGDNSHGQIGDKSTTSRLTPFKASLKNVTDFCIYKLHYGRVGAIDKDGNLWMWGYNGFGHIGDGSTTDRLTPYRVLENVKEYKLEYSYSGAIDKDGDLWMWGYNGDGQIGNGTTTTCLSPVKITLGDEPEPVNTETVKATINGKGYASYSFFLNNGDDLLKNTTVKYYFVSKNGTTSTVSSASSNENGLITISTNMYDNTASMTAQPITDELHAKFIYKPDGITNVLDDLDIPFDITVEPLSFKQEWSLGTKESVAVGIGEGAGVTIGPLEAEATVAEAEVSKEVGTTLSVMHEYDSGKRNLELSQAFDQNIGINGSIGPKADVEAGVDIEGTLASAEAGVKLGSKVRYAKKIKNYQASPANLKEVGRFLMETEAVGRGNAFLVSLVNMIDPKAYNNVAGGASVVVNAGAKAGSLEVYNGKGKDNKEIEKKTYAEGTLASAEYNSVYSYENAKDTTADTPEISKTMKKESGIDVKALSVEAKMPVLGKCEAGIYKNTFIPKNYSLSYSTGEEGDKLTISELSGLGITQKTSTEDNWFYASAQNVETDQEAYDILVYQGEDLERLRNNMSPIDRFVQGKSWFILDSVFSDINEFVQKSGVDADYKKDISESVMFGYEFPLAAKLELEGNLNVGFKGTEKITYTGESGIYRSYKTNEDDDYSGLAIPTAVNEFDISQNRVSLTSLVGEAFNSVVEEAKQFIVKKVVPIIEKSKEAFCTVKADIKDGFEKNWKIVIETVKDGNYIASQENLKHIGSDVLESELISYSVLTHDLSVHSDDENMIAAAGDPLGESAVTLGCPYDVFVTEEDGTTEVEDFSEAPLGITLEYSDAMLETAGVTSENEDKIEIFKYDENNYEYISVGGKVDAAANSVTVDGISTRGQFILAVQGKYLKKDESSDDPENPVDPSNPGNDGVEPGDLPSGKEVPNGIWIGGLKKTYPYTGNAIKPAFRVYYGKKRLTAGVDYTVKYKNNKKVGTNAKATIELKGNFSGSRDAGFEIVKNDLSAGIISAEPLAVAYRKGKKNNNLKPVLTMNGAKLKFGKNDLEYKYLKVSSNEPGSCSEVGDYIVRVTAKSTSTGYTGTIDVPLTVTDKPVMSAVKITPDKKSMAYTGEKQMPSFTLRYNGQALAAGTYSMTTVSGDDYIEPGNHTVVFEGNGRDVFGRKAVTYKITGKRKIGDSYTAVEIASSDLVNGKVPYATGGAKPAFKVTYKGTVLKSGRDYTVSFKGNSKAGKTATATIKGKGSYTGSKPVSFTVGECDLKSMLLVISDRAASTKKDDFKKTKILFTDKDFKDQKLKNGRDYTAEFTVSSGSATPSAGEKVTVKITAKSGGNYTGQTQTDFMIIEKEKDLSKAKVVVNGNKPYAYTGRAVTPSGNEVVVTLGGKPVGSENYDISCYNNVSKGNNAVLFVTGKGDMKGYKAVKFKIRAADAQKDTGLWDGVINSFRLRFAY